MYPNEYLIQLADTCDQLDHKGLADEIDNLIRTGSFMKVSQYVGVIGYILKNQRAVMNCIRKKRVVSDSSVQQITFECIKEYQDGQKYDDEEWIGKYASSDSRKYVNSVLKTAAENGIDINTATRKLIEKLSSDNDLSEDFQNMNKISEMIKTAGLQDREEFVFFSNVLNKLAAGEWGKTVDWLRYRMPGFDGSFKSQIKKIQTTLQGLQNSQRYLNRALTPIVTSTTMDKQEISQLKSAITQNDFNSILQSVKRIRTKYQNDPKMLGLISTIITTMTTISKSVQTLGNEMAPMMENPRARKSAGNYMDQANSLINSLMRNPLNNQNLLGLSTAIHNIDMGLQQSIYNTPQQTSNQPTQQGQSQTPTGQQASQTQQQQAQQQAQQQKKTTKRPDLCKSYNEVKKHLSKDPKNQPIIGPLDKAFISTCNTGKTI